MRRVRNSWREQDVLTSWRRVYCYTRRPGVCRKVKNWSNRRDRRKVAKEIVNQRAEAEE